jgi:hypothetical protein
VSGERWERLLLPRSDSGASLEYLSVGRTVALSVSIRRSASRRLGSREGSPVRPQGSTDDVSSPIWTVSLPKRQLSATGSLPTRPGRPANIRVLVRGSSPPPA